MFPQSVTPNLHALAKQFVNLDNFLDTGETSGVGWNWTTAAHATDEIEPTNPSTMARAARRTIGRAQTGT